MATTASDLCYRPAIGSLLLLFCGQPDRHMHPHETWAAASQSGLPGQEPTRRGQLHGALLLRNSADAHRAPAAGMEGHRIMRQSFARQLRHLLLLLHAAPFWIHPLAPYLATAGAGRTAPLTVCFCMACMVVLAAAAGRPLGSGLLVGKGGWRQRDLPV